MPALGLFGVKQTLRAQLEIRDPIRCEVLGSHGDEAFIRRFGLRFCRYDTRTHECPNS